MASAQAYVSHGPRGIVLCVPGSSRFIDQTKQQACVDGCSRRGELYYWCNKVVEVCALKPDVDQLSRGDLTQVGEGGVTLSGG